MVKPPAEPGVGMRLLALATVLAAASGFLVMGVAAKALGPAPYADFAAYWGLFFALGGVANGLMQEVTRGVRAMQPESRPGAVRILPAGGLVGLGLAAVVLLSGIAWPLVDLDDHDGAAVLIMAAGILGFSLQASTAGALSGTGRWGLYGVLIAIDSFLRLAVAAFAWKVGLAGLGFALATVIGAVAWALLLVVSPDVRRALRSRPDVEVGRFWQNTGNAMIASAGTSALVVGFPVLVKATSHADPPALVGTVILAVTFTRASLLLPLTSVQSAMIVYFVERLDRGAHALLPPLAVIAGTGFVGAAAAWAFGPWVLRTLNDEGFALGTATHTGAATSRQRKALATMGRRGGKKAAERWNDRNSEYTQIVTNKLEQANSRRAMGSRVTARQIANFFDEGMFQTGKYPSIPEAMQEFGVSRPTINRALKKAEISLPRGRRTSKN